MEVNSRERYNVKDVGDRIDKAQSGLLALVAPNRVRKTFGGDTGSLVLASGIADLGEY